ncbi:MAG: c-type cytochrome [Candidatus Solibacter usitatus]|nr:c-type cytochrome [Candidatus Solibacter usitatus]
MRSKLTFFSAAILFTTSCSAPPPKPLSARPVGKPVSIPIPLGLPPLPVPANNPPTAETIALGEKLFFSTSLSVDNTIACASCHDPGKGFSDGQPVSTGVGGKKGNRSAPTVLNAAYAQFQFWDGRVDSLEAQAKGPIANPIEMAHTLEGAAKKVALDDGLRKMFEAGFGTNLQGQSAVTIERIAAAIASFERTLLRGNSPFDRYQYGGDQKAMSAAAMRGLAVFRDAKKGNCAVCHTIEEKFALFTDDKFHNLGSGMNAAGELTDMGRFAISKREGDQGAFRTPTLRNIAETAPYMHDGSLKTLKEVVDFYVGGGNANPHLDKEIKSLDHLTKQERADLVAFMEALTGEPAK